MKKAFIQFWSYEGSPAGATLHLNKEVFLKWSKMNKELTVFEELKEVEVSTNLYFEMLYNDGSFELRQNSVNNLIKLGEIKSEEFSDVE
jgi:hypothetical protein